jgi:hypothetical protein
MNITLTNIPKFIYNIRDDIKIHIIDSTYNYYLIYFTDNLGNNILIPDNIIIYEYGNMCKIILSKLDNECYHLLSNTNYKIEYNNNIIFTIETIPTKLKDNFYNYSNSKKIDN